MLLENVILSFPSLHKAKSIAGGDPRFGASFLLQNTHPQFNQLNAEFTTIRNAAFPSGVPRTANVCLELYQDKYVGKEYFDPRFNGWWVLSCTRAEEDGKPDVVTTSLERITDPGLVFPGQLVHVNFGMSAYTKGTGGVGGWLNGVMLTGVEGPMGRLDNRPSVEQMFSGVGQTYPTREAAMAAQQQAPAPQQQVNQAPAPNRAPPPQMNKTAPPPRLLLTELARQQGYTLDSFDPAQGWTDEVIIAQGFAIKPSY
jgi:hypothetical protein